MATLLFIVNVFMPVDRILPGQKVVNIPSANAAIPKPQIPEKIVLSGKPVRIIVPSHQIDLVIEPGFYNPDNGDWSISEINANYALITPVVNDAGGNTLIYGHNSWPVFYRLKNLSAGDTVQIYTENAQIFTYLFKNSESVRPDNVELFNYSGPPKLTLQTCAGSWYEQRQLAEFTLLKVEKI